jgi:SagB-type dehydrogenase family enzyme
VITSRVLLVVTTAALLNFGMGAMPKEQRRQPEVIKLPEARDEGKISLEKAMRDRRSLRAYARDPLTLAEVSQLLWAAQGVTDREGHRTAPSAGALYPLDLYLVVGNVEGLPRGFYKYRCRQHDLIRVGQEDLRPRLASAALEQECIRKGAAVIVLSAVYGRTTRKYGKRGIRYVHMEVGHVAQNVYLQAISLGLGTVFIGAFNDDEVKEILSLPREEEPLGLMPVGRRR